MTCPVFTLQRKKQDFVHQIFLSSIINWSWICWIRQFSYQSHRNMTSQLLYTREQAFKNSLGLSLWPRQGEWRLFPPPSVSLLQRIYQKAKERVSLSALCNTFHRLTTALQLVGARLQTSQPTKQLQGGFNSAPYISLWPILPRDSKQQLFFFRWPGHWLVLRLLWQSKWQSVSGWLAATTYTNVTVSLVCITKCNFPYITKYSILFYLYRTYSILYCILILYSMLFYLCYSILLFFSFFSLNFFTALVLCAVTKNLGLIKAYLSLAYLILSSSTTLYIAVFRQLPAGP